MARKFLSCRIEKADKDVCAPLTNDPNWIHTSTRTEASEHDGARGWCSVLRALCFRLAGRPRTVLSCLPGWLHLLDRHHPRQHGAFDVAASDGRRVGRDHSARARGRYPNPAVDVDSIHSHSVEIESDLFVDESGRNGSDSGAAGKGRTLSESGVLYRSRGPLFCDLV